MTRKATIAESTRLAKPNRRNFLLSGAAVGVAASTAMGRNNRSDAQEAQPSSIQDTPFELSELPIDQLQVMMGTGAFTAQSLTESYLARIREIDGSLGSVIELNPDAIEIATELDRERREKGPRGPLHGIPVMIKDNIDTADKMKTTAGSLALIDAPKPPEDSFVVKRLRKAGAVLIAKTNLSEWANIRSTNSTSGWSGRGGQTNNPYALDRNPCGSSSGSGVAVSANLCSVAVGTETDGSVVCPAACCSVVGIKPTVGLVGRTGIIPISHSQDTAGPMARTVRDAAILLGALAGVDPNDAITNDNKGHAKTDYTPFLVETGLQGAKIAVARNFMGFQSSVDKVIDTAVEAMKSGGAIIVDSQELSVTDDSADAETTVLQYELKADMAAYLSRLGQESQMKTLKDLIEFNQQNKEKEMPYFGQEFFEQAEEKGPLTEHEYVEARARCLRLNRTEGIDAAMDKLEVDCFVAPTLSIPCLTDWVNGDSWKGFSTSPAAVSGYPSITVPAGYVFGLPVGISFFGRAWSEPTLLRLAYAYERLKPIRKQPQFLKTANLSI